MSGIVGQNWYLKCLVLQQLVTKLTFLKGSNVLNILETTIKSNENPNHLQYKYNNNFRLACVTSTCKYIQSKICKTFLHFQFLLEDYLRTVRRVKLEVRPLFLPQVVRLSSLLLPALRSVTWTSEEWKEFIEKANLAIKSFDVLVTRVHDIYTNRIIYMLNGMQYVSLITLPGTCF